MRFLRNHCLAPTTSIVTSMTQPVTVSHVTDGDVLVMPGPARSPCLP